MIHLTSCVLQTSCEDCRRDDVGDPHGGAECMDDGELGPRNRLPSLPIFCGAQADVTEVCGLVILPQVKDSEESRYLTLCLVQNEPVLEVLMNER